MPLFIQKPQPVECRKVTAPTDAGDKALTDLCEWVIDHGGRADHDGIKIRFRSRSGWTSACIGDWIIANADGTFGVLRDEQFFKYYEPAPVDEKAKGLVNCQVSGDLGLVNGKLSNHLRIVVNEATLIANCVLIAD